MDNSIQSTRLRIYLSSTDEFDHQPIYEAILEKAKNFGLSGASVFKEIMGFGQNSENSTQTVWEITQKLPIVVEIIDSQDKISSFLKSMQPFIDSMTKGFLITTENVSIDLVHDGIKVPHND
jgi:hypothetical protein